MKWSDLDPTEDWTWEIRGKLVLAAWIVAALAVSLPEIALLLAFPLFPLGLLYGIPGWDSIFPPPASPPTRSEGPLAEFLLPLAAGWAIYLAISVTTIVTKRRSIFFIFYMGLVSLLVLNVRGCHIFMRQLE